MTSIWLIGLLMYFLGGTLVFGRVTAVSYSVLNTKEIEVVVPWFKESKTSLILGTALVIFSWIGLAFMFIFKRTLFYFDETEGFNFRFSYSEMEKKIKEENVLMDEQIDGDW